jgi:hypothetical protein
MEAYDIELPAGDDEATEVFVGGAPGTRSTARSRRAQRGGAATIQILPVSPPATEA